MSVPVASDIIISSLEEHPNECGIVADWILSEWGKLPILDYFEAIANSKGWAHSFPHSLVAHAKGSIVGTVSILLDDLETRPEFNPWLGCLYVHPEWRRRGIGTSLLTAAEKLATIRWRISDLYLFTENQTALYAKHGWKIVETDHYRKREITIMIKRL